MDRGAWQAIVHVVTELDMTERISFELFNNSIYIITLKRHSVQFSCSFASDSVTPWTVAHQASLSITNCQSLLKVMSIKLVMPSNHLLLCCPLLLLPSEDIHFSSLTQSCLTLCNPMNHSTPGLPVPHQILEFEQSHVHQVGDAIQTSHPVISFSSCLQSFPASGFQ